MAGSTMLSSNSTTRKNGFFASSLWCRMLINKAIAPTARMVATTMIVKKSLVARRPGFVFSAIIFLSLQMPDAIVATHARRDVLLCVRRGRDCLNDLLMTIEARLLSHAAVAFANLNVLRKSPGREFQRMPESVVGFGPIF